MSRSPARTSETILSIIGSNHARSEVRRVLPTRTTRRLACPARGEHVREVPILGHDDGLVLDRIAPQIAILRIARADVDDVLSDVTVFAQHARQSRG
jgi:hypothetical protein